METSIIDTLQELQAVELYHPLKDGTFANSMFSELQRYVHFDSASLNLCVIEDGCRLPELDCFYFHEPLIMGPNYQKFFNLDFFTPRVLIQGYTALIGSDYYNIDEWHENPFYTHHCRQFDVENAMAIAARIPGHKRKYLVLYLYTATPRRIFTKQELQTIEEFFPSLFNMWLHRLGFICDENLNERLALLRKFSISPKQHQLILLIAQNPMGSSKEYAKELHVSERTIEHMLNSTYKKLAIDGYHKTKKIELFRRFQFLSQ